MRPDSRDLPLADLSARHLGLTEAVANAYIEAARVCLDRHHESPSDFRLIDDLEETITKVTWDATGDREKKAWANTDDATRDGAYAMALASTELSRSFVAVSRAETKTGADYYVAPVDVEIDDMESWIRLEVSGTDLDEQQVGYRVTQKVKQAKEGNSNLPALAAVVGFRAAVISLKSVDTE
jgi:hypothetical protein